VGRGSLAADLGGHSARVKSFEVNAFGGKAAGQRGTSTSTTSWRPRGELKWQTSTRPRSAAIFPKINGIAGRYGGTRDAIAPPTTRALSSRASDVVLDSYGGSFKGATVGDAHAHRVP
jgi:hypothetical protein